MKLGTEVGLSPGQSVLDGNPSPQKKEHRTSTFRTISIVTKQLPISATAELLSHYLVFIRHFYPTIMVVWLRYIN